MEDQALAYLCAVDRAAATPPALTADGRRLLSAAMTVLWPLGALAWVPVGSAACATSVVGYSDVDLLAVFLDPVRHGVDESTLPYSAAELRRAAAGEGAFPEAVLPNAAFNLVAERLETLPPMPGFLPSQRKQPAAFFSSTHDGPNVEIVPTIEADVLWDGSLTRPSSGLVRTTFPAPPPENRWLGTDPGLHSTVLDQSRTGLDYSVRQLIRLLKLVKYRHGAPVLSYFLELFTLRWLEGSEQITAHSAEDIESQHGQTWSLRDLGQLIDDLPALLRALVLHLRQMVAGTAPPVVDLATPERTGLVHGVDVTPDADMAIEILSVAAFEAEQARTRTRQGDDTALDYWRMLLRDRSS